MTNFKKKLYNALVIAPFVLTGLVIAIAICIDLLNSIPLATMTISHGGWLFILTLVVAFVMFIWLIRIVTLHAQFPLLNIYPEDTTLFNTRSNRVKYFPNETCLWRSENAQYANRSIWTSTYISYPSVNPEKRRIHPISANPKVRDLEYEVEFEAKEEFTQDTEESLQKRVDVFGMERLREAISVPKVVKSALYEFNETYSKDLVQFYNPESYEQQAKFAALLTDALSSQLAKTPFQISAVRFSLN